MLMSNKCRGILWFLKNLTHSISLFLHNKRISMKKLYTLLLLSGCAFAGHEEDESIRRLVDEHRVEQESINRVTEEPLPQLHVSVQQPLEDKMQEQDQKPKATKSVFADLITREQFDAYAKTAYERSGVWFTAARADVDNHLISAACGAVVGALVYRRASIRLTRVFGALLVASK